MGYEPAIHFFTIVLNGEPFIRHHLGIFQQLPFRWHWHIIEGVAELRHDTAWSLANGGHIDAACHSGGLSNDGTSEYLDALQQAHPGQVTVYRKPGGAFWNGKLEMVNAPLVNIQDPCLLWQVDADEYWTQAQIEACRRLFQDHLEERAAFFWCHFYVGPELVLSSRETYGNNSRVEWLRVWRFQPGDRWISHEPPMLGNRWQLLHARFRRLLGKRPKIRLKKLKAFSHAVTEAHGLVFTHLAYVLPSQAAFKEQYYGYPGAQAQWEALQAQEHFPVALKDYFAWVKDGATVDRASALGLPPWVNR
jgi:hypothetical protein